MLISVFKTMALNLLLLLAASSVSAQTEYIVTVNPSNAKITKIDSIPGLMLLHNSPAYDQTTKRSSIIGHWDTQPAHLFTVDVASGATISSPLISTPGILAFEYSRTTGILYGIVYNNNTGLCYLATVNTVIGTYTIIRDIPGLSGVSDPPVIDEANQHLFIKSGNQILTIDLATGNILANPVLTKYFFGGCFDNVSRNMYGLTYRLGSTPGSSSIFSICKADVITGVVTIIADLPGISGITGVGGNTAYNENDKIFYFEANSPNPGSFLYSANVNTGNIISVAPVPSSGVVDHDNLIFFRYDNQSAKLYAWLWEAHTVVTTPPPYDSSCRMDIDTKIYFNPSNHSLIINKKTTACKVTLSIYNMLGQLMIKNRMISEGYNEIQLSKFSYGIYYYEFIADGNKGLFSGRFLKQ